MSDAERLSKGRGTRWILLALAALVLAGCASRDGPTESQGPSGSRDEPISSPPSAEWREASRMPTPRVEHCAAVVGSTFYVIGGYIIANPVSLPGAAGGLPTGPPTGRVDLYDAARDSWASGPDFPAPLDHCLAVGHEDTVYVFHHGQSGASHKIGLGEPRWTKITDPPHGHNAGVAALIEDRIYVTAGASPEVDVYDPATDSWKTLAAPLPTPRDHTAGAAVAGRLFVVAGDVGGHSENTEANQELDPSNETWSNRTPIPLVRGSVAGVAWRGLVLVMGGQDGRTNVPALPDVDAYDPVTGNWTALPPMPSGRHGFPAGVWNDRVYAFAGAPQMGVSGFDAVHVLEAV